MVETVAIEDVGDFDVRSARLCSVVVADNVITTTGDIQVVSLVDDLPAEVLTAAGGRRFKEVHWS